MKRLLLSLFLLCSIAHATNVPFLAWYARDAHGKILPGSTLSFYGAGGGIAKNVYSTETCAASLGATLTADGAGRFRRFYMGALNDCSSPLLYKVVLKTAGGSIVWTEDNIAALKTDLSGIVSATSNSATAAITGTNTSNGYGVSAVTTAGSSHALYVAADTSTPVKSAVHIVPQDATPSAPTKGDLWFDATTGRIRFYDGTIASEVVTVGALGANQNGGTATAVGTGNGFSGTGGPTSGAGGYFTGGAPNGNGATFVGKGTGRGGSGTGGATSGIGLYGLGGAPNGIGVYGGGVGSGAGVFGAGTDTAPAFYGLNTNDSDGVMGVTLQGGTAGRFDSSAGDGYACSCVADPTSPNTASLHIGVQDTDPLFPLEGDVYYNGVSHHLYVRKAAAWAQLD